MPAWYCLRTAPQREFAVEEILKKKGLQAFCPVKVAWKRVGPKKRRTPYSYPMVPRYVFVACENPWHDVLHKPWCRNVSGVVTIDGRAGVVRPAEMDRLARMSGNAIPTNTTSIHRSFAPGDRVEIVSGPYQGWLVPIESIKGEAAKVLLNMFGSERPIEIPLESLEAA